VTASGSPRTPRSGGRGSPARSEVASFNRSCDNHNTGSRPRSVDPVQDIVDHELERPPRAAGGQHSQRGERLVRLLARQPPRGLDAAGRGYQIDRALQVTLLGKLRLDELGLRGARGGCRVDEVRSNRAHVPTPLECVQGSNRVVIGMPGGTAKGPAWPCLAHVPPSSRGFATPGRRQRRCKSAPDPWQTNHTRDAAQPRRRPALPLGPWAGQQGTGIANTLCGAPALATAAARRWRAP
jgi:hypothetical protein